MAFRFSPPSLEINSGIAGGDQLELMRRHGNWFDLVGGDPAAG